MTFLEFLSLSSSIRREVKERVDPLMKYDDGEYHARFCLSKLTVYHLMSDVCQTVDLPSFSNIIRSVYCENHGKFTTATVMNDNGALHVFQPMPKPLLAIARDPRWLE